jgi:uncharacterized protein (TIGR02246 family)
MKTLGVMVTIVVLGVAGLSAQQKAAKAGSADDAAIAKVRSAYQTAASAQDAAGIAKLYTTDGIEMPPNAPAAKGRAAIEAYHKSFSQQFMVHGLTITPTETHVHGDFATDIGTYKQQLMANKGAGTIDDTGKYVVLLRKDASGAWLLTHVIYNSDVPLPAPPAPAKK